VLLYIVLRHAVPVEVQEAEVMRSYLRSEASIAWIALLSESPKHHSIVPVRPRWPAEILPAWNRCSGSDRQVVASDRGCLKPVVSINPVFAQSVSGNDCSCRDSWCSRSEDTRAPPTPLREVLFHRRRERLRFSATAAPTNRSQGNRHKRGYSSRKHRFPGNWPNLE
jgi:hypothetical protein